MAGQYLLADPEVYSSQIMLIIPPGGILCEGVAKLLPPVALTPIPRLSPNHPKNKLRSGWAVHHQLTAVSVRGHDCCRCTKPPANSLLTLHPLMQKMPAHTPLSLRATAVTFWLLPIHETSNLAITPSVRDEAHTHSQMTGDKRWWNLRVFKPGIHTYLQLLSE